ncbi:nitrogen regulation protein NR(II) [Candidatus Eisenbacteria bacterium]|uniref:Nitrogen regulation protein NR(II) n=1 Tax=Eiseniibacteriota bacterium TaxID=2212470 RepID=A0ABV6YKG8_UNCEI
MRIRAENVSLGGSLAPGFSSVAALASSYQWVAEVLQATKVTEGLSDYFLVAIDREGIAHPLAGTLSVEQIGPRILESLESPVFWTRVDAQTRYTCEMLGSCLPAWPRERGLGGTFLKDGEKPLGALLFPERPHGGTTEVSGENVSGASASPGVDQTRALANLDQPLLELILRHWRLSHESRAVGDFARALIGTQQGGVLAIDAEGRVTYLSRLGEDILGIKAHEAVGADCARVLRPSVEGEHPLLTGLTGKLDRVELYITNRQGRDLPIFLSLTPVTSVSGATRGLVCFFRDLSEERALDQEARRRERLAVIGELAAGAAHEIRNPLTGIGNCAQILQMRLTDQEQNRRMADLILKETQRLDRIITSLLGFARPGRPQMQETRIEDVVRSSLQLEQPVFEKSGVRCDLRVVGMIPSIYVDPGQIHQVIVNLYHNATDAMPDGGLLTLEVSVVRRRRHTRRRIGAPPTVCTYPAMGRWFASCAFG